ncbi:MAG TPA: hypothetical protein VFL81_01355 [Candidatus Saccharimonadales bacterium]|nr:hypothetical protein [Candidatus Saccharimonadales bacterium]
MTFRQTFQEVYKDRSFIIVSLLMLLLVLAAIVLTAYFVRPSDFQLPNRYSAFGVTNIYRGNWYYAFNFLGLSVLIAIVNSFVSLKLYASKGRRLALSYLWLSFLTLVVTVITMAAILRLTNLGQ